MAEENDPDGEGTQSGSDNKQAQRVIQQRIGTGLNLSNVADKWAAMQAPPTPPAEFVLLLSSAHGTAAQPHAPSM